MNTKDTHQEIPRAFEALCRELGIKTRYILYYMIIGICDRNQTLSGYITFTPSSIFEAKARGRSL